MSKYTKMLIMICLADLIISANERDLQLFFKYGTDVQDAVQDRCGEFLRAGGCRVAVEELLRFSHQRAELLGVAVLQ